MKLPQELLSETLVASSAPLLCLDMPLLQLQCLRGKTRTLLNGVSHWCLGRGQHRVYSA